MVCSVMGTGITTNDRMVVYLEPVQSCHVLRPSDSIDEMDGVKILDGTDTLDTKSFVLQCSSE
jgi:hypothetical protein